MPIQKVILLFCLLLIVYTIEAQDFPTQEFYAIEFGENQELKSNEISDIKKDKNGLLYLATEQGLHIWDGEKLKTIPTPSKNGSQNIDEPITSLFMDEADQVYVCTSQGINLVDTKTGTYQWEESKSPYENNNLTITDILKLKDGSFWVSNDKEIFQWNVQADSFSKLNYHETTELNKAGYIIQIASDENRIWILTNTDLYIYNHKLKTSNKISMNLCDECENMSIHVTDNDLYILSSNGFLSILNKNTNIVMNKLKLNNGFPAYGSIPMIEDGQGNIWVLSSLTSESYIIKNKSEIYIPKLIDTKNEFNPRNAILCADGSLWIHSINRLFYISCHRLKSEKIKYARNGSGREKILGKNIFISDTILWSTNRNYQIANYNLKDKIHTSFAAIPEKMKFLGFAPSLIFPISQDSILIGYAFNAFPFSNLEIYFAPINKLSYFFILEPNNQKINFLYFGSQFYDSIKNNYDYSTYALFNKHEIYLNQKTKIESFSFADKTLKRFKLNLDTNIYSDLFYAMYIDVNKIIWLASVQQSENNETRKACIIQFNPKTNSTKIYEQDGNQEFGFGSSIVLTITSDAEGHIYLQNKFGVSILNPLTGIINSFSINDLLPSNKYISMLVDNHHNIWLGTYQNGIVVLNSKTQKTFSINTTQSLLDLNMTMQAVAKDEKGKLYFWSQFGINIFDPSDEIFSLHASPVVISDILVRGNSIVKNALVKNNSSYVFDHSENDLEFIFSCLSFENRSKIKYAYLLEGIDDGWVYSENRNYTNYHNLSPGKYFLKVKAANCFGIWNDEPTVIEILIHPAFWQTLVFKLCCTFFVAAIIYWIYKLKLEKAIAVERIRSRISRDLHDDLGSTLSSISILSEHAKNIRAKNPDEIETIIQKINDSSIKMNDSLQDLVWAVKPENDYLEELYIRMEQFASGVLETKNIHFIFITPKNISKEKLNPEFVRNLYLIFKEAINNISKYSKCENVKISIEENNHLLKLCIEDDGIGFNPATIKKGNGMNNMNKRTKELQGQLEIFTSLGKGTKIQLTCKITS